jgi:hypothetical protein
LDCTGGRISPYRWQDNSASGMRQWLHNVATSTSRFSIEVAQNPVFAGSSAIRIGIGRRISSGLPTSM